MNQTFFLKRPFADIPINIQKNFLIVLLEIKFAIGNPTKPKNQTHSFT